MTFPLCFMYKRFVFRVAPILQNTRNIFILFHKCARYYNLFRIHLLGFVLMHRYIIYFTTAIINSYFIDLQIHTEISRLKQSTARRTKYTRNLVNLSIYLALLTDFHVYPTGKLLNLHVKMHSHTRAPCLGFRVNFDFC